jgi:hypothetical protein
MSLRRNGNLRDMRKRRVGVTARSREIVGQQATGALQIDAEIAAPLVSRTPKGTVAEATTECGWKRGDTNTGAKDNRAESSSEAMVENRGANGDCGGGRRAAGAHEALPHTSPGGKPPETPGPLSLGLDCTEGRPSVKGSLRRQKPAALDRGPSFQRQHPRHEGKGANGPGAHRASRWSGTQPIKASGRPRAPRA